MKAQRPSYVLIADTEPAAAGALWRFALHNATSGDTVTACDSEPGDSADRQELMAVVRGLEAIEQPATVTLITRSRSVHHGITRGLEAWRNAHWRWERYGRMTPIRHADLWRRIDHALAIHTVVCRMWRADRHTSPPQDRPRPDRRGAASSRVRFDSPAIVVVPRRSRRVVRLADPAVA